ncbi:MAG: rhodanese family protein [Caulobacterales bacterium]|nr:rhodanese family protein [Caulobacterales bacterium]
MSTLIPLSAVEAANRLKTGRAVLVDIREPDEVAREHIAQAVAAPLSAFETARLELRSGRQVIFMCRTGNRTGANCDRLAARIADTAYVLDGGLEAWKAAGLPTVVNRKAPLELMRQVQMAAGGLILTGSALALTVHPAFWGVPIFVGAGLFTAGATGFCGMARLLALAPWNRRAAAVP